MAVYINKERRHDQAVQVRRYSVERAEWYESLRRGFLKFCDTLSSDSPHLQGFRDLEHFRKEGLETIEQNLAFWRAKAEQGADDPWVDFRASMDIALDPNMTLESFQEMMRPAPSVSYRGR